MIKVMVGLVGLALLLVVSLGGLLFHFGNGGGKVLPKFGLMVSNIESVALEAVKGQLVSPATAEFSEVEQTGYQDLILWNGSVGKPELGGLKGVVVTGQVDSQNRFGAMVRASFEALVVDGAVVQCELVER